MSEQGGTGIYCGDFPTAVTVLGRYGVLVYSQSGAQASPTDRRLGAGELEWSGTGVMVPTVTNSNGEVALSTADALKLVSADVSGAGGATVGGVLSSLIGIGAKIGSPRNGSVSTDIETMRSSIEGRLPVALSSGRILADVGHIQDGAVSAASLSPQAIDAIQSRDVQALQQLSILRGTADEIAGDTDAIAAKLADGSSGNSDRNDAPVQSGDRAIYAGSDYSAENGNALEWSSEAWPDLTSAVILMVHDSASEVPIACTGSVASGTGTTQRVRVEMSSEQTQALGVLGRTTNHRFRLMATLADASVRVLVRGWLTVR
jgi:hypothetical protein